MHQFGTGRPDQQDEKELIRFSEQIMKKIETKGVYEGRTTRKSQLQRI